MAENGFEFFELNGSQVGHVSRNHLVFEKGQLLRDAGLDKAEFVFEFVICVGCEVVFFDVGFLASLVDRVDCFQEGVEGWKVFVQPLDVSELVFDVAFETGYRESKGVESQSKVVGFVCERSTERIFDTVLLLAYPLSVNLSVLYTDSRIVSLMI